MPAWGAVTLFARPKDRPLIGGYNVSEGKRWLRRTVTRCDAAPVSLNPQAQQAQSMKLIWRPLDLMLVLLLLAAMAFTVLRGLVRGGGKTILPLLT